MAVRNLSKDIDNVNQAEPSNSGAINLRQSDRRRRNGTIMLSGQAGSGKTTSALILAAGMLAERYTDKMQGVETYPIEPFKTKMYKDYSNIGHLIGIVDTEDRADCAAEQLYVDDKKRVYKLGNFLIANLSAPFTTDRYIASINALKKQGCQVIIVDSITEWWDHIVAHNTEGVSYWGKIKPEQDRLMKALFYDNDVQIIICAKASEKYQLDGGGNTGRSFSMKNLGLAPQIRDKFWFPPKALLLLDSDHRISIFNNKDNTGLFVNMRSISPVDGGMWEQWRSGKMSESARYIYKISVLLDVHGKEKIVKLRNKWYATMQLDAKTTKLAHLSEIQLVELYTYITAQIEKQEAELTF